MCQLDEARSLNTQYYCSLGLTVHKDNKVPEIVRSVRVQFGIEKVQAGIVHPVLKDPDYILD